MEQVGACYVSAEPVSCQGYQAEHYLRLGCRLASLRTRPRNSVPNINTCFWKDGRRQMSVSCIKAH